MLKFSQGNEMLSVTNKAGPYVAPRSDTNTAFSEAQKQGADGRESVNFDNVMSASNFAIAEQFEKDKQAVGENGELRIGETKNDKDFREMLERVSGKKQEALKNKLNKDDYLNLMVTQLKYQDPTKPLENHEMATQLAQFNTVEQLMGVNKTLEAMQNQSAQSNIDKLTPYLGRVVEVSGSKLNVSPEMQVSQGIVDLPSKAGSVSVLIKDSQGSVVRTIGLGEKASGRHTIDWDGKTDSGVNAKSGEYNFEVVASAVDGKEMKAKTSFTSKVEAIVDLANGGRLDTQNGKVEAKDILAIRPEQVAADSKRTENADAKRDALRAERDAKRAERAARTTQAEPVANASKAEPVANASKAEPVATMQPTGQLSSTSKLAQ
jgi:flagellar basal-body rod modification protein FlgD